MNKPKKDKTWDELVLQVIQIRCMARISKLDSASLELEDVMAETIREETTRVSRQMRDTLEGMIDRHGELDEGYCKRSNDKLLARLERKREQAKR